MPEISGSTTELKISAAIKNLRKNFPGMEILENEPMANHCSFKAGGPARAFAAPLTQNDFFGTVSELKAQRVAPYILGNGTNVVFADEGVPKLFILSTANLQDIKLTDAHSIYAHCGVSLSRLASFALENSLSGLEFASGIPGTVGGGIIMDAGAYGGELRDCIKEVTALDMETLDIVHLSNKDCAFGYRKSIFQDKRNLIVLGGEFNLSEGSKDEISSKMKELNARRRDKQPLDVPSCGSTFRRPAGYYAAALIDECGLRGHKIGGAQVSEKHAGFVINAGNATVKDLSDMIAYIQKTVFEKKNIELVPEAIIIPSDYSLKV